MWVQDDSDQACLAWLWYISCDYWFFIVSMIILYYLCNNKKWTAFIMTGTIFAVSYIWTTILTFKIPTLFSYSPGLKLPDGIDGWSQQREKLEAEEGWPYYWTDTYFKPWCRIIPYLFASLVGFYLADAKKLTHRKIEKKTSIKSIMFRGFSKYSLINLLYFTILLTIIYIQLPQFYEDFYPICFMSFYDSMVHNLWGIVLAGLIYCLEINQQGWMYNLLSSNVWTIPARLGFSTYLVHFYVLQGVINWIYIDNIYANQWFLVMNIIFGIFVSYLVGTVFYVLVEAPMSVLSQVFMKFLVGKTK